MECHEERMNKSEVGAKDDGGRDIPYWRDVEIMATSEDIVTMKAPCN